MGISFWSNKGLSHGGRHRLVTELSPVRGAGGRALRHPLSGLFHLYSEKNGLTASLTLFVAQDIDALIWNLDLTNESNKPIAFDVFAYVELSQYLAREENLPGYYLK